MNADFEHYHHSPDLELEEDFNSPPDNASGRTAAKLSPERFELLSAYIDGELAPEDRKQVEHWLDTDSSVQRLYTHMLRLQESIKSLPLPEFETSDTHELIDQVFARVDRQPRVLVTWAGAGAAIAATCVAFFSGAIFGNRSFSPQIANTENTPSQSVAYSPSPEIDFGTETDSLMIGLDRPVVDIPSATFVDWKGTSNN